MRKYLSASVLVAFLSPLAFALPALSPLDIDQDLYSPLGIQFVPVDARVTTSAEGAEYTVIENSVTLTGTGTLTVGSSNDAPYPRVSLATDNNTITKTKVLYSITTKDDWNGEFKAPLPMMKPQSSAIQTRVTREADSSTGVTEQRATVTVIEAYKMGINGESFKFSGGADIAFPSNALNGTKLYFAKKDGNGQWVQTSQFCIVQGGVCQATFTEFDEIVIIQEAVEKCSTEIVENGRWGSAPDCRIICDSDFAPNTAGTSCVAVETDLTLEDLEEQNSQDIEQSEPIEEPQVEPTAETQTEVEVEIMVPEPAQEPVAADTAETNDTMRDTETTVEEAPQFDITDIIEDDTLLGSSPKEDDMVFGSSNQANGTNNSALGLQTKLLPATGSSSLYAIALLLVAGGFVLSLRKTA